MKRLMILGGSRYALPVIRAAHGLGAYVITCDYLPDNIANRYSDEYCNVSIVEQEAVLEKARELRIDGIMSFGCDPGVVTAAYVAEQMGLPNCGPYESVCILQNKGRFRQFLRQLRAESAERLLPPSEAPTPPPRGRGKAGLRRFRWWGWLEWGWSGWGSHHLA